MSHTFFWHDYETFGIDTRRDAPAQFAGIRTDADLNEIGDPVTLYCKPPRDALPDPQSCLITGITPQLCEQRGLPEHAFAQRVLAELGAEGTIGVGYNTLAFDDEVTRHLFWRNLIEPYGREWQNRCSRWDLFNVVRCAYALRPEGIQWPMKEDGRPSLKLEHLSAANGLLHEAAHDALSDVRATIALARLLRQCQPRLFDYCLKLRDKREVQAVIGSIDAHRQPFLHVSGKYDPQRGYTAVVWPLARHPTNTNEVIVWDLDSDPCDLLGLSASVIRQRLFTRREELPEGVKRLPIKSIHINQSPVVIKGVATLSEARATHWGIDVAQALANAQRGLANLAALDAIPWAEVFQREQAVGEALDAEQTLYGGAFLSQSDRRTLERLRTLDGSRLALERAAFEDGRLEELLLRYRARNWADTLSPEEQAQWLAHCRARLIDGKGGHRPVSQVLEKIDELAQQAIDTDDERAQAVLEALVDWVQAIVP
jgi:exodeoxyribonuclease-1